MSTIVRYFEHSFTLPFFAIGVKTDLFQSCGHCWVFQICWHSECSTFTASSFRIWSSSTGIPSPPLALLLHWSGDQWRNNSRKNEGMEPKQKQYPVVDVTGDRSKVPCCKEQYCIGTWNVRSMNQRKLEVVKQEMARVKVDILGISELKWTGMGEFKSDINLLLQAGIH